MSRVINYYPHTFSDWLTAKRRERDMLGWAEGRVQAWLGGEITKTLRVTHDDLTRTLAWAEQLKLKLKEGTDRCSKP